MEAMSAVFFAYALRSLARCIPAGILCLAIISPLRQGCADDLPSPDELPAPDDPTELQRTWDASAIYLQLRDIDIDVQSTLPPQARDTLFARIPAGTKLPAVLFLHGCRGIGGEAVLLALLASRGYAVFEPDGFARTRPVVCGRVPVDDPTVVWTINASLAEITFDISQLRKLPWIDSTHLYLAGFSRGGELTAWYPGDEFKARVAMSASCRRGIRGQPPLLAIFAKNDTEMTDFTERCSKATKYLEINSNAHEVYRDLKVQKAIFDWLDRYLK
jgi:dienelactone hydrolase